MNLSKKLERKRKEKEKARESNLALNWKKYRKFNSIWFTMCWVQKTIDNTITIFLKTTGTMKAMIRWTGSYGRSLQRHFIFPRAPHKVQDLWRDSQWTALCTMCGGNRRRKLSNSSNKLKCKGVNLSICRFVNNGIDSIEENFVLNSVSDVQG